jgi:hypothetical protein
MAERMAWHLERVGARSQQGHEMNQLTLRRVYVRDVVLGTRPRWRTASCGSGPYLTFSCKRRHFYPSCQQKRVVEFGSGFAPMCLIRYPGLFSQRGCGISPTKEPSSMQPKTATTRMFLQRKSGSPPCVRMSPNRGADDQVL